MTSCASSCSTVDEVREEEDFDFFRPEILPSILRCHPGRLFSPPLEEGSDTRAAWSREEDLLYETTEVTIGDENSGYGSCCGFDGCRRVYGRILRFPLLCNRGRLESVSVVVLGEEPMVETKDSPDQGRAVRANTRTAKRGILLYNPNGYLVIRMQLKKG